MEWKNHLTEMLGISYPIVQAPMLGVTTPAMVATVANNGGLGSLPIGGLSPEKALELIRKTKSLTDKPFAVNLFSHEVFDGDSNIHGMQDNLMSLASLHGIPYEKQIAASFRYYSYREQIRVLITEKIPVVSFTFGIPAPGIVAELKAAGVVLIGTATSSAEALLLEENDVDIITAQGMEAGGHRGSFLDTETPPLIGTIALIPQIVKKISRPVLAAGGINDGKSIKAAFALGAQGVQAGTVFIPSIESAATQGHKQAILESTETDVVLTKAITGRWARGLRNTLITSIESAGIDILPYPVQIAQTLPIRTIAQQQNNKEFISLWAGQALSKATEVLPVATIFKLLIEETEAIK